MTPASIRLARPSDLRHLAAVEDAGAALFEQFFGQTHAALTTPAPSGGERDQVGTLLVADVGGEVVGFAHLVFPDDRAHLEQVSVLPSYGRRGIGAALVRAAMAEARGSGHRELSLCTFADVPWNGPSYRALGFADVDDPEPFQARLRAHEQHLGLDEAGRRVVMSVSLARR